MRLKKGVKLDNLSSQWQELVVTSGSEGKHSRYSAHYRGQAVDLRTRYFDETTAKLAAEWLGERLTEDFYVLLEKDHIHLEWRPAREN